MTSSRYPFVPLSRVLIQDQRFVSEPDDRQYSKLSVKLYGKGVILDRPTEGANLRMRRHQLAKAGQVILSEIWGKKGAIGIVPREGEGALCTSHFFLFDILRDQIEPGYLEAVFRSNYLQDQLGGEARGTTGYAAVRPRHLLDATIPLPSLDVQRRLVLKLEELSLRLKQTRSLREQSTILVDSLRHSAAETLLSSVRANRHPLGDLVTLRGGGTPSKANPLLWDGSIPWVTPKDMKLRNILDSQDHLSQLALECSPAKVIEPGCVLIVVRGMILAHTVPTAVLRVPATINQDMKALITCPDLDPDYLCMSLWAWNRRLLNLVKRSTHDTRKLETHRLLDFEIPLPDRQVQSQVARSLTSLFQWCDQLADLQMASQREIDALLPALLNRAICGP